MHRKARYSITDLTLLLGILMVTSIVALHNLGAECYWLDELYSLIASAGKSRAVPHDAIVQTMPNPTQLSHDSTWQSTCRVLRDDVHPPLYFCLAQSWRRFIGSDEWSLRVFSVGSSVLSIIPVFFVSGSMKTRRAALWAALLFGVSFANVYLAQQARHYCLAMLFSNTSFCAFVRLGGCWNARSRSRRIGWGCAYGISTLAGLLTHYLVGLTVLSQVAFALSRFRGSLLRAYLVSMIVSCTAFGLIWGDCLFYQLTTDAGYSWIVRSASSTPTVVAKFGTLVARLFCDVDFSQNSFSVALLGIALLVGASWLSSRQAGYWNLLFLLWYFVPTLTLASIDVVTGSDALGHIRLAFLALPGLCWIIALAASSLPRRFGDAASTLVLVTMLVTLSYPTRANPETRQLVKYMTTTHHDHELIVLDGNRSPPWFLDYMLFEIAHYGPWLGPVLLLDSEPAQDLQNQISRLGEILVINGRYTKPDLLLRNHVLTSESARLFRGLGRTYAYRQRVHLESEYSPTQQGDRGP